MERTFKTWLRKKVPDWNMRPWAWKQGWLYYEAYPDSYNNPYGIDNPHTDWMKFELFSEGYDLASYYDGC